MSCLQVINFEYALGQEESTIPVYVIGVITDVCAAQILARLSQRQAPRAFQTMASLFNV
jgi:hypothetical protein